MYCKAIKAEVRFKNLTGEVGGSWKIKCGRRSKAHGGSGEDTACCLASHFADKTERDGLDPAPVLTGGSLKVVAVIVLEL